MILITDSGSSKCTWCFVRKNEEYKRITTTGINPSTQTGEQIRRIMDEELTPTLNDIFFTPDEPVEQIFFYGAGCTESQKTAMKEILNRYFPQAQTEVESDMTGAARSLFQHGKGIACILGTGANSCLYDGQGIVAQTPALGYILGDEGSGAYLGRMLLRAVFKKKLPPQITDEFLTEYDLTLAQVLKRTYRTPMANRFLASLTPFLSRHRHEPALRELLHQAFRDFAFFNLKAYQEESRNVSFIGSIAHYFREELEESLQQEGFHLEQVIQDPMDGLRKYHAATPKS